MIFPTLIGTPIFTAAANHLWQSTAVAAIAGILTFVLRKNHARTRHALWFAASVKFLIPFSLLISLGTHLPAPTPSGSANNTIYSSIDQVSQPFAASAPIAPTAASTGRPASLNLLSQALCAIWLFGTLVILAHWAIRWRRIAQLAQAATPLREGREFNALRRMEKSLRMRRPLELRQSHQALEPGIFGIAHPILLWPADISAHLSDDHLEAILAHELGHVRRRDNLAAAIHMLVEAIFWFHPLVWWLGARLVEERERACDEEVLQLGNSPQIYAESILKTCEFCVESSLPCVSGVTGADLKNRIIHIMSKRLGTNLNLGKKLMLTTAAVAALAGPLAFGLVYASEIRAHAQSTDPSRPLPAFEVATIKPSSSNDTRVGLLMSQNMFTTTNISTQELIKFAFNLRSNDQIVGAPTWVASKPFDIEAKEDEALVAALQKLPQADNTDQVRLMVQSLLADRFKLKVTHQMKELPVYALVVAKGGIKLTPTDPAVLSGDHPQMIRMMGRGNLSGTDVPINALTNALSRQPETGGRVVVDKTGLTGSYSWTLQWTPETSGPLGAPGGPNAAPETSEPSFFTALQEQLGLKLESQKAPVDTIVIDHIELPSLN
jgi:bla regulator protein BlaR1